MAISKVYKSLKKNLQKFDDYRNYFFIKIDQKIIEFNKQVAKLYKKVIFDYFNLELTLYIYKNRQKPALNNFTNIIYGHFYNDEDLIQYKETYDDGETRPKIHMGNKDELYKNESDQVIQHNDFDIVKNIENHLKEEYIEENGYDKLYIYDQRPYVEHNHKELYNGLENVVFITDSDIKSEFDENKNILKLI